MAVTTRSAHVLSPACSLAVPFHSLATVVANLRQVTVIMAEKRDRSLDFPFAAQRIEQLALFPCPRTVSGAQLFTMSPAYSGILRLPFESLVVLLTAHPVFQSTVRSEDRENSINTCLAVRMTHIHVPELPRLLMIFII
jgi:hypothetical protein